MRVRMKGSISGHSVSADGDYVAGPQVGDVVEVDDELGALWLAQSMAEAVTDEPEPAKVETAAQGGEGVETTAANAKVSKR